VLIGGIIVGLLLGLLAGGHIGNLANIRLRWIGLLFAAVIIRFGTEALLNAGVPLVETLRLPLLLSGFVLLLIGLWVNRGYPGLVLAFIGILMNAVVITINGGYMPIWLPSLIAAGFEPADVTSALHVVVGGGLDADFLLNAIFLADIFPIPFPVVQNVASLGDLFLTFGLGFFLFASVVRVPTEQETAAQRKEREAERQLEGRTGTTRLPHGEGATVAAQTGLAPAIADTAALERPIVMGSGGVGLATPALAPLPDAAALEAADEAEGGATGRPIVPAIPIPRPSPEIVERVRRHPYVRLALNGSFSALWAGQLISLFGDRIHQVALAAVVLITTGSALASALVFVAAFIPNLLFSPVAGALVDRWDHREVLVVSDLLRAATVLMIPIAAVVNVALVYPLVFLLTSISIFFRPARVAILPRIVEEDELLSANSALWVGETFADIIGWPLAGLFVITLGSSLPIAFWLDAATYVASALLLSTIVVKSSTAGATGPQAAAGAPARAGIVTELKAGWRFLRGEPTLLANTVQATVAQLTVGILIALTPAYALAVFGGQAIGWEAIYGFIETAESLGSLIGGFAIGLLGTRIARGKMIISGYTFFGLFLLLLSMSGDLGLVLGFSFGAGIANMVFVIPSQTLFQERTPPDLMGRVVGFRFALVFGSMTLAMAVGGVMAQLAGVTVVIATFALVSMGAGLAGLFVPALRDA
jgi:MFS family permease